MMPLPIEQPNTNFDVKPELNSESILASVSDSPSFNQNNLNLIANYNKNIIQNISRDIIQENQLKKLEKFKSVKGKLPPPNLEKYQKKNSKQVQPKVGKNLNYVFPSKQTSKSVKRRRSKDDNEEVVAKNQSDREPPAHPKQHFTIEVPNSCSSRFLQECYFTNGQYASHMGTLTDKPDVKRAISHVIAEAFNDGDHRFN